ncbi:MAG: phage portal protein [Clostridia bacterium]|jgi:SPP1 family phage portal protein|nr:phage portal protein [Clostridia bacterium]MCI2000069.1 phage portal protein [Clostridia bacterium]MCI2014397.1 phage portal protein [Clostridia bacterium]
MFLTETDLINAKITADRKINESDILKYIINEDENSDKKRKMIEGERYYTYDHDICKKDFRQSRISESVTDDNGDESEKITNFTNPNRSNHHNVNAFHRILVDQKVGYIIGRKPVIRVNFDKEKDSKFEKAVDKFTSEDFNEVLQNLLTGASNKGYEALHVYYDKNGELKFCIVPAEEIIPIYDSRFETDLEQLIRYYDTIVIRNGHKYIRKRVEWWTKENVTYYVEDDNHNFIYDESVDKNPCPHWWNVSLEDGFEKKRSENNWNKVPFIILKNNSRATTDLEAVKGLIDAYDLLSSEATNNLLDLVELYWVIQGYGGETAGAIAKKLQINKAVNISDSSGNVEAKQTDISMEGRLNYMKMLRKDIFQFGQGVDTDVDRLGSSTSGVTLKFQYTLLELKAAGISVQLKKCINELLWYMIEDYNRKHKTNYSTDMINVCLRRNAITNDYETVQMIQMSEGLISDETLISNHPFVDEISKEK